MIEKTRIASPRATSCVVLGLLVAAGTSVVGARTAAAQSTAAYRTVVIIGDTQVHVGGGHDADYADFAAMIDWIVSNKHNENIDFVMQVGDITNLGLWMPLPAQQCQDAPAVEREDCRDGANMCFAQAPAGCFPVLDTFCPPCEAAHATVDSEWQRFVAQWSRLEPAPSNDWSGIPYAIVRGNHDNVGVSEDIDTDVPGFNHYFGKQHFEELEQAFEGSDRYFEHVETYPGGDQDGHAWKFGIGAQKVLVVGPSVWPDQEQRSWANDVLSRHPSTPTILTSHDMVERNDLWADVVAPMATTAPQLFMTAQGHISRDQKSVIDIGGYQVLRTVNDWSYPATADHSYMTLVRFYFDHVDHVEAVTYSPATDSVLEIETNQLGLQPFGIGHDADHDGTPDHLDPCPHCPVDNPLELQSVDGSGASVVLQFNDTIDPASITDLNNYFLPGGRVLAADTAESNQVSLDTTALNRGTHTILVAGVRNESGVAMVPATITFDVESSSEDPEDIEDGADSLATDSATSGCSIEGSSPGWPAFTLCGLLFVRRRRRAQGNRLRHTAQNTCASMPRTVLMLVFLAMGCGSVVDPVTAEGGDAPVDAGLVNPDAIERNGDAALSSEPFAGPCTIETRSIADDALISSERREYDANSLLVFIDRDLDGDGITDEIYQRSYDADGNLITENWDRDVDGDLDVLRVYVVESGGEVQFSTTDFNPDDEPNPIRFLPPDRRQWIYNEGGQITTLCNDSNYVDDPGYNRIERRTYSADGQLRFRRIDHAYTGPCDPLVAIAPTYIEERIYDDRTGFLVGIERQDSNPMPVDGTISHVEERSYDDDGNLLLTLVDTAPRSVPVDGIFDQRRNYTYECW